MKTYLPIPPLCVFMTTFLYLQSVYTHGHTCWTPPAQTLLHVSEPNIELAVAYNVDRFRITPMYTQTFTSLTESEQIKKEIVEYAIDYWSNTLKPKTPFKGPFRAARGCIKNRFEVHEEPDGRKYEYCLNGCAKTPNCFNYPIPSNLLDKCRVMDNGRPTIKENSTGSGLPDTDYVLFVDAQQGQECEGGTLAYAVICQAEATLDRPTLGYINFCPKSISLKHPLLRISRDTALHEMAHAFGFSNVMYAFMRTEQGEPRTARNSKTGLPLLGTAKDGSYIPSSDTIGYTSRTWVSVAGTHQRKVTLLKTPNVLETARKHFGCPTLDGIEMENQGGSGTASAHFEKRVVMNELMAGSIDYGSIPSKLTLAFFMDSGWYNVDISKAQDYQWAKDAGCNFVMKSCYEYMEERKAAAQSLLPWCNKIYSNETSCLNYLNAFGTCNLMKNTDRLSQEYQYFSSLPGVNQEDLPFYGGQDALADYCPYPAPSLLDENNPSTFCDHPENSQFEDKNVNVLLEGYGTDAMCFNHDKEEPWQSRQCQVINNFPPTTASCHRFECITGRGLVVSIGPKQFNCPTLGGFIQVDTVGKVAYVKGRLECPKCSSICGSNCPMGPVQTTIPDSQPSSIPCSLAGLQLLVQRELLLLTSVICLFIFLK